MRIAATTARLLSAVLVAAGATLAAAPAAGQWSPPEQRAQQAQAALSARYAALWTTLAGEPRQRFAAEQRQWLNTARWEAQRACLAQRSLQDEAAAADCLAEVTLVHLRSLAPAPLASR